MEKGGSGSSKRNGYQNAAGSEFRRSSTLGINLAQKVAAASLQKAIEPVIINASSYIHKTEEVNTIVKGFEEL